MQNSWTCISFIIYIIQTYLICVMYSKHKSFVEDFKYFPIIQNKILSIGFILENWQLNCNNCCFAMDLFLKKTVPSHQLKAIFWWPKLTLKVIDSIFHFLATVSIIQLTVKYFHIKQEYMTFFLKQWVSWAL